MPSIPGVTGSRSFPRAPRMRNVSGFRTRVLKQGSSSEFREYHHQQVRDVKGRFAGGWGFAWQGLEAVDRALTDTNERLHANLKRGVDALVDEMVAYMKENAPWQDQTGNARAGLQGTAVWQDDEHFTIFLGHGNNVEYGIWLEVRWGGKFAIVVPTVERYRQMGIGTRIVTLT